MIQSVHFQNFRCLRDVKLNLSPLTVLVGPNSSGKTTVLHGLTLPSPSTENRWRQDRSLTLSITYTYSKGRSGYVVGQPGQPGRLSNSHSAQPLTLDLVSLRQQNVLAAAHQLRPTGDNLTNVFATLTRQQQGAVARELCRLVPMFSDVDLQPTADGRHQLRFQDRWNPDLWFAPNQVSDGTMLVLAFIVLQYQNPPADIITIEEPERALHPYLLEELIQLLRKMTTGEIGKKPVQVVLATHSAEMLEYVRPEEVRFLTRSPEDGSVQVNEAPTDSTNWQQVYKEYRESLGSIWLSGSMGGVPGR
ncbi:MAG TPA: AAA family ATPase [Myxococcaceae bacterium]